MSRRRLYYLLEVGKFVKERTVNQADAEKVGWTKLQIITRHVNQSSLTDAEVAEYVKLALATKAYALRQALREGVSVSKRTAMFRLSDDANNELSEALIAFGAEHASGPLEERGGALADRSGSDALKASAQNSKIASATCKGAYAESLAQLSLQTGAQGDTQWRKRSGL